MIAIASPTGSLLRAIPDHTDRVFGFHRLFGFISEEAAVERLRNRKAHGLSNRRAEWLFRFKLSPKSSGFDVAALAGCKANALGDGSWQLISAHGTYVVASQAELDVESITSKEEEGSSKWLLLFAIVFF